MEKNIYFSRQQRQRRNVWRRIKLYLIGGGMLVLLALFFYFIQSPVFEIKSIEVHNLTILSQEEFLNNLKPIVVDGFFSRLLGFNNFLVWFGKIEYDHPAIIAINPQRYFGDKKLVLEVQERQPYGIWCVTDSDTCHWFDREGVLFAEAPTVEGALLYKINSASKPDTKKFDFAYLEKLLTALSNHGVSVKNITVDEKRLELVATTHEQTKITISLRFDASNLLTTALESIVSKVGLENMDYLDLTVENRIYYK